jgi:ACS family pantothenate transporter-like MFS transporter
MVPYTAYVIGLGSYLYMNLWLRSTEDYSTATLINVIPTGGYGLSIFMSLVYSWTSDAIRMRWPILLFGAIPPLTGNIIVRAKLKQVIKY